MDTCSLGSWNHKTFIHYAAERDQEVMTRQSVLENELIRKLPGVRIIVKQLTRREVRDIIELKRTSMYFVVFSAFLAIS
jgi:hypothetical protein